MEELFEEYDEELTEYDKTQIEMYKELEKIGMEKLDYCYKSLLGITEMDPEDTTHGLEAEGKILMQRTFREMLPIFHKYHPGKEDLFALEYLHQMYPKMSKAFGSAHVSFSITKRTGSTFMSLECPYDGVEQAANGCEHAFADACGAQFVGLGR